MFYNFNYAGWYVGTTDEATARSTDQVPNSLSTADIEGELRACWHDTHWVVKPFVYTAPPEETPTVPTEDPRMWWIDVGPFYDRFGVDALAIAASDNGACKAVQTSTGVRKYIDLKDPKVAQMIDMLIAMNQPAAQPWAPGSGPMTAAKKATILDTPTTEKERHIKGL